MNRFVDALGLAEMDRAEATDGITDLKPRQDCRTATGHSLHLPRRRLGDPHPMSMTTMLHLHPHYPLSMPAPHPYLVSNHNEVQKSLKAKMMNG